MVQAIVFGMLGLLSCFLSEYLSGFIIDKKCKTHEITVLQELHIKFRILLYILNAGLWTFAGFYIEEPVLALLFSLLFSLAILIGRTDYRIHIIPNEFVLTMLLIGLILQINDLSPRTFLIALVSMIGMSSLFLIVAKVIGFQKVGAGDVKLAGAMGFVLGYPDILTALLAMSVAMLLYCFAGFAVYRLTMKSFMPLAPFLMIGLTAGLLTGILA